MVLATIAARAAIAVVASASLLGVWKLLSLAVLWRAKRAGSSDPVGLKGFARGTPGFLIFSSPHCAPCVYAQKPAATKLYGDLGGAIQLIEIDVTEEPGLAERYGVVSLPTVFLLDAAGNPRRVNHGLVSTVELRRQIAPYLT
jgi:thiol-disulfide isomerase/thioredoxin